MIFYTKLTKLKKSNKRSFPRPSFTVLELIIVIIILGILAYTLTFKFSSNKLQAAADKLINDIRYTQSLALKEDKYQPFPKDDSIIEQNRSKYWFKQWWQLKFKISSGSYLYSIFSDSPASDTDIFNLQPSVEELAINPLTTKYASSIGSSSTYSNSDYNLSKYGIKLIIKPDGTPYDAHHTNPAITFLFDNFGNVFLDEGVSGDAGDINPLDSNKRKLLTTRKNIKLCMDDPCNFNKDRCIQINITPSGYVYKSICK
jgi:type II secretory pathway pseudopilin PulG